MVSIYVLCHPETLEIRYVGKTINIHKRMVAHKNEKRETRKCRWLKYLANRGLAPAIFIIDVVQDNEWEEAERKWIRHFKDLGARLTNHTEGGDGVSGLDEESRAKVAAATKKRMNDPEFIKKIMTPERAAKISAALTGKSKSKEHVSKLKQNKPGWKQTEETKKKISKALEGNQYRKGICHTYKTKEHLRQTSTGNKSRTGLTNTPEHNKLISRFMKGRPKTEEQRKRMSEARRLWWERKRDVTQIPNTSG
jgi:GIY-YIG catalytic domain/NUMOD3 motif